MVMSRVHLPGQIQLPVSPSLALEDVGECVKEDVDVCNIEDIDPQNRKAWRSGNLPQEMGNYLQSKYPTRIK